jgi:hypothetical protein
LEFEARESTKFEEDVNTRTGDSCLASDISTTSIFTRSGRWHGMAHERTELRSGSAGAQALHRLGPFMARRRHVPPTCGGDSLARSGQFLSVLISGGAQATVLWLAIASKDSGSAARRTRLVIEKGGRSSWIQRVAL